MSNVTPYRGARVADAAKAQRRPLKLVAHEMGYHYTSILRLDRGDGPILRRYVVAAVRVLNLPEHELFLTRRPTVRRGPGRRPNADRQEGAA